MTGFQILQALMWAMFAGLVIALAIVMHKTVTAYLSYTSACQRMARFAKKDPNDQCAENIKMGPNQTKTILRLHAPHRKGK